MLQQLRQRSMPQMIAPIRDPQVVGPTVSLNADWWSRMLVRPWLAPATRVFSRLGTAALRAFEPLDRGEFRWEFLVPGREEELSRLDKFIVCSTFIGLALLLQAVFDPGESFADHLSYIAFFFSYAMGNPIGYRLIAIAASTFEIISHVVETAGGADDFIPVFYNGVFTIINMYYVLRFYLAKQPVEFTPLEERLYTSCFESLGVRRRQFRSLLAGAEWHHTDEGEVCFVEGDSLQDVYIPVTGAMAVLKGGSPVTTIEPFNVIGEVALLENLDGADMHPARATVVAQPGATYVSIPQSVFYALMFADAEFAFAAQLMISRTLSRKLGKAREDQAVMSDTVIRSAQLAMEVDARLAEATSLAAASQRAIKLPCDASAAASLLQQESGGEGAGSSGGGISDADGARSTAEWLRGAIDSSRKVGEEAPREEEDASAAAREEYGVPHDVMTDEL